MCKHGDTVPLLVPIPAYLSHTGEFRWAQKDVDRCIAPIVQALNAGGVYTAGCCCGHGASNGNIILHDGRNLIIQADHYAAPDESVEAAIRKGFADMPGLKVQVKGAHVAGEPVRGVQCCSRCGTNLVDNRADEYTSYFRLGALVQIDRPGNVSAISVEFYEVDSLCSLD